MKIKEVIGSMVGDLVKEYIRIKLEGLIDKGIDRVSTIVSSLLGFIILVVSFLLFFLFATISLALFISEVLGKNYLGFIIISIFYLLIGIVSWRFRGWIFKRPLAKVLQKTFKTERINNSN
jgi:hypothetical protein